MTRRQIVLVAFAAAALGPAWWLPSDGLSAEERRLVGTWRLRPASTGDARVWEFRPDHQWAYRRTRPGAGEVSGSGMWAFAGGALVIDVEAGPIRRALRPVGRLVGVADAGVSVTVPASVTAAEMAFALTDGARSAWSRVAPD